MHVRGATPVDELLEVGSVSLHSRRADSTGLEEQYPSTACWSSIVEITFQRKRYLSVAS
jgi:hypothetical protein